MRRYSVQAICVIVCLFPAKKAYYLKSSTELNSRLTPSTSNGSSVNVHCEKGIPGMGYLWKAFDIVNHVLKVCFP